MKIYYFTYGTIAITTLLSLLAFQSRTIADRMIFSTSKILEEHEYHRIITSMFIHAGPGHFVFNMFSFYSFSMVVEFHYGLKAAALIYFASGIGGSLLSLLLNRKNMSYLALGASGAVSGIIFSSIFLVPGGSVYIFFIPIAIPAWAFGILFVLSSIYGIDRNVGNIGHDAHLGGALTGVAVTGILYPNALAANYFLLAGISVPALIFLVYVHFKVR